MGTNDVDDGPLLLEAHLWEHDLHIFELIVGEQAHALADEQLGAA
jgi:hypothetical protein